MSAIIPERVSGTLDGDFIVFLIGMRVNRWWKVHKWLRVAAAMPRMLRELAKQPELGFLGAEQFFGRTTLMLQYWRSMDHLMSYAKSRDSAHLPAWSAFNKLVGTSGDVGIWHETYRIHPGDFESVYVNMMPFGLGKVGKRIPARTHARDRIAANAGVAPAAENAQSAAAV